MPWRLPVISNDVPDKRIFLFNFNMTEFVGRFSSKARILFEIQTVQGEHAVQRLLNCLRHSGLLDGISAAEYWPLLPALNSSIRLYEKGDLVIREGMCVPSIGILVRGCVRTIKHDANGNEMLLNLLTPHELLGLDIVVTPSQISSISALCTQAAAIAFLPYPQLSWEEKLPPELHIRIFRNLLTILGNENMRRLYRLELLNDKSLRSRILTYLNLLSKKQGCATVRVPYNREEFAQYLCVQRTSLSHELIRMQREGLIHFHKNQFTLLKGK